MAEARPRFCTSCGAALQSGARFCAQCGTAVAPAGEAAPALESGGERRQATILFADLCGYTALSRALDAEDVQALMARVFAALDGEVRSHGGAVDKHVGDAVMAVFGAPVSHGNDAERAVASALAMHAAIAALGRELGRDLAIHVGVASGEVVAGATGSEIHRGYTVTGDAANLAARLVERAGPRETVVSDGVRAAVARAVAFEPLGEAALRGLDAPVRLWRVAGARDAGAPPALPLVGRDAEVGQIAALVDASARGEGRVVLVRGDPGIGKTRLIEETLAAAAARGVRALRALVLDFGVARGGDAASTIARALADAEPDAGDSHAPALAELLGRPRDALAAASWDAMTPAARESARRAALTALATAAAARAPLLIAVEDLHWADPDTLGRLAALAHAARGSRIALLLTTRLDGDPIDRSWRAAAGATPFSAIDLAPLGEQAARALAGSLLADAGGAAAACVARAEGNPLFLIELARNVAEASSALPDTVQSVVQARIDRLAPADKLLVQCASVAGQRVDPALLAALAGNASAESGRLVAAGLLRAEGDGLLFGHALIRDGVYATLLRARRRELHRRAAAFYAGRDPVLEARHLDRADDPGAPAAYRAAAQDAASGSRFDEAIALAARGLELAADGPERAPLARARAGAELELGRTQPALDGFRLAVAAAGDDAERCRAWLGVAGALRILSRLDDAFAALDEAARARGASALPREAAQEHWLRGNLFFARGDAASCRAEHERALALARAAGSFELEIRALNGLGDAAYAAGQMGSALEYFERCSALCREHGFGRIDLSNRFMIGHCRHYLLDFVGAVDAVRGAAAESARVGSRLGEMTNHESLGILLVHLGRDTEAVEELDIALALSRELGTRRYDAIILSARATALLRLGRVEEARTNAAEAVEVAHETGTGFAGAAVLGVQALVAGDATRRRAALAEGETLLARGGVAHNFLWFYRDAMEATRRAGELDEALRYAAALEAFTSAEPLPLVDFQIRRTRALVAAARGRPDRAELAALRDRARAAGLGAALPEFDAALAGAN